MRRALKTAALWPASLTALSLLGCVDYEDPPITWEGEIIRFGADEPDAVCGQTREWMDGRALALAELFAAAGAEVYPQVDYYWVPQSWSEQQVCPPESKGCAHDGVIRTQMVPHEHELVHGLRVQGLPRVFEEGLATTYGDLGGVYLPAPRERLLEMFERGDVYDGPDYARASHFVNFLLEGYGLEPLLAIADHADYSANWTQTQAAFLASYGFPLQDALSEYEAYPECSTLTLVNRDIACAQDPVLIDPPPGSGSVSYSKQISCSEPDVYGPFYGSMFTETTIELTNFFEVGMYVRLLGDAGPGTKILLSACGGCTDAKWMWLRDDVPERFLYLPSGRYVLRMFRPIDDPGETGVWFSFYE